MLEGAVGIVTTNRLGANASVAVRWNRWPVFDSTNTSTRFRRERRRSCFHRLTDLILAQRQGCVPLTRERTRTNKREVGLLGRLEHCPCAQIKSLISLAAHQSRRVSPDLVAQGDRRRQDRQTNIRTSVCASPDNWGELVVNSI
jgi:hypothetical protein